MYFYLKMRLNAFGVGICAPKPLLGLLKQMEKKGGRRGGGKECNGSARLNAAYFTFRKFRPTKTR